MLFLFHPVTTWKLLQNENTEKYALLYKYLKQENPDTT